MPDPSRSLADIRARPLGDKIMLGAAVGAFVCAFLPWVSAFGIGVAGIRGDGVITAIAAAVGALSLLLWSTQLDRQLAIQGLIALVVIAVSAYHAFDDFAGIGAQLSLLAGIVWAAGVYIARRDARGASTAAAQPSAAADKSAVPPVREVDDENPPS